MCIFSERYISYWSYFKSPAVRGTFKTFSGLVGNQSGGSPARHVVCWLWRYKQASGGRVPSFGSCSATGHVPPQLWTSASSAVWAYKDSRNMFRLSSLFWKKKVWEEPIVYFPWYDTGHIENDASNNSSIAACVFITSVKFLPSGCLATIGGYTHTHAATWSHKPTLFFKNRKVG
jgi:hypothetical protein